MSDPITTMQLLDQLQGARRMWDALLGRLSPEQMNEPGAVGHWSIKDLIAHITWAERETVGMLRARAFVGSEWWTLPLDERNAAVYEANRHRPLAEVLADSTDVFARLLAAVQPLTAADLSDPNWFAQMPFPLPTWEVIARNSSRHYQSHMPDLQAWVERVGRAQDPRRS